MTSIDSNLRTAYYTLLHFTAKHITAQHNTAPRNNIMGIQGIIRPPPDIRVVADKTAMFVAKNGRAFESRIIGSAKGKTPKFAFLQQTSPFNAYYEDRIKHFQSGGATADEEKKEEDAAKKKGEKEAASLKATKEKANAPAKDNVTKQKASIMDPVAKAIMGQRSMIANHLKKEKAKRRNAAEAAKSTATAASENSPSTATPDGGTNTGEGESDPKQEPRSANANASEKMLPLPAPPIPLDTVHVVAPYHLTPTQIETIQLVAQFVAMDGKGGPFLPALVSREWANPDFGFCQPRNIHFSYFSALVDAYRKIITDFVKAADIESSTANTDTTMGGTALSGENEPIPATRIEEDGKAQVPSKPTKPVYDVQAALNDAAYRTEYERELEHRRQKHQENSNAEMEDGEIANAIDWHDFVVVETIDFPIEEQVDVGLSMLPTKTATTTATTPTNIATSTNVLEGGAAADMEMEESSDEDEDDADSNIRVVPSYTPKVVGTYDPSTARAIDPITGKSVSVADMPEHMRIQLLDPKWAEERKKFQDKQKDSNLVGGDAVVANIARISQMAATSSSAAVSASGAGSNATKRPGSSAVGAPTAPVVGPATGQHHRQQQYSGYRGPPASGGDGVKTEQPPPKRQRTTADLPPALLQQQQKHKITIAPPLVTNPLSANNNNININNDDLAVDTPTKPPITDPAQAASTTEVPPATVAAEPAEEKKLLPAVEFLATLGENPVVELMIRVPNDATSQNWNFFGQTLTLSGIDPKSCAKDIKAVLSKEHLNNIPVNKIQLKSTDAKGKFLNNTATLAALNIGPTALLELKMKQRGGRK